MSAWTGWVLRGDIWDAVVTASSEARCWSALIEAADNPRATLAVKPTGERPDPPVARLHGGGHIGRGHRQRRRENGRAGA